MAVNWSTVELIDLMVQKYGVGTATDRADLLRWLNAGNDAILAARAWWFMENIQSFSFIEATPKITFGVDVADVLDIWDADDNPLSWMDARDFDHLYRPTSATGAAEIWSTYHMDHPQQLVVVQFWLIPIATVNGKARIRLVQTALNEGGVGPLIPQEYRIAAAFKGLELMAMKSDSAQNASQYKAEADELLVKMMAEDARHTKGRG